MSDRNDDDRGVTRLSFIRNSAGVAAGMAAIGVPAVAVLSEEGKGVPIEPTSPTAPREPVMAYVRDATRGEVTVMSGLRETTYRDKGLVDRLLTAAPEASALGGSDVIAP